MEGYVYLIGNPKLCWYKIGKSKTPEVRVRDLGILLPFKIEVIGVWRAMDHSLMEKALHEMHAKNRINGEWFEFSRNKAHEVFSAIPAENRIYPIEGVKHSLASFSNIHEDTQNNSKVIGLKCVKLRGNFTHEEREAKRLEGIEKSKRKRAEKLNNIQLSLF